VSGSPRVTTSVAVDYLSWHRESDKQSCKLKTGANVDVRLYGMDPSAHPTVTMDGSPFTGLETESAGTVLVLKAVPAGEHLLEVTNSG
jgi:hypothetical protein